MQSPHNHRAAGTRLISREATRDIQAKLEREDEFSGKMTKNGMKDGRATINQK